MKNKNAWDILKKEIQQNNLVKRRRFDSVDKIKTIWQVIHYYKYSPWVSLGMTFLNRQSARDSIKVGKKVGVCSKLVKFVRC